MWKKFECISPKNINLAWKPGNFFMDKINKNKKNRRIKKDKNVPSLKMRIYMEVF